PEVCLGMVEGLPAAGPPGRGHWQTDDAWLGSRYLSIVDPKSGDQPLTGGAERGICLVGDGMIHNHRRIRAAAGADRFYTASDLRSEEHTSELQSRFALVCRLLLEKKNDCHDY